MSDKLQKYKNELTVKLATAEVLEATAEVALEAYNVELKRWEDAHSELVSARDEAQLAHTLAKKEFDTRRVEIRDELKFHFFEHPEDQKAIDAFGFRTEIDVHWMIDLKVSNFTAIQVLAKTAPFLLNIDHKAVKKYIKNNAIEIEGQYCMPVDLYAWHGRIFDATNKTVPLVYNDKLVKEQDEISPVVDMAGQKPKS